MISLTMDQLEIVKTILKDILPECEVRAFGSRVKGMHKPHSDLDLAIYSKDQLPLNVIFRLADAFEESILPFRVDVVDYQRVSPSFQQIIDRDNVIIQEGTE